MIIIGEKLNSAIPRVREAIRTRDAAFIRELAGRQAEAGADYLDINTALENETEDMEWMVRTVQEVTDLPLCIDSTDPRTMEKGLKTLRGKGMINSLTLEKSRLEGILPLVLAYGFPVIALTSDDRGIPRTAEERLKLTDRLVNTLARHNYNTENIYIDPLVLPLAVNTDNALIFFQCLKSIKETYQVKTVSGLSNVSHSMPSRKIINRYFLSICMSCGMDAAIMDPTDKKIATAVLALNLLLGKDRFGRSYIKAHRSENLAD
jgi:5-methyltetrahydrofolate--homocysteine methyltransferase